MIEINLLKQGHGILYRQKYIRTNVAHRRTKIVLLLILLLSSLAVYFMPAKTSNINKFIVAKLFNSLNIVWFEESSSSFLRWFEENLLLLKDQSSFQKLRGYGSGIEKIILPKEETFSTSSMLLTKIFVCSSRHGAPRYGGPAVANKS